MLRICSVVVWVLLYPCIACVEVRYVAPPLPVRERVVLIAPEYDADQVSQLIAGFEEWRPAGARWEYRIEAADPSVRHRDTIIVHTGAIARSRGWGGSWACEGVTAGAVTRWSNDGDIDVCVPLGLREDFYWPIAAHEAGHILGVGHQDSGLMAPLMVVVDGRVGPRVGERELSLARAGQ